MSEGKFIWSNLNHLTSGLTLAFAQTLVELRTSTYWFSSSLNSRLWWQVAGRAKDDPDSLHSDSSALMSWCHFLPGKLPSSLVSFPFFFPLLESLSAQEMSPEVESCSSSSNKVKFSSLPSEYRVGWTRPLFYLLRRMGLPALTQTQSCLAYDPDAVLSSLR